MRINVRSLVVLIALVAVVGVAAFAAACGSSADATATTAATETTVASDSGTPTSGTISVKGMVDNPTTLTVESLKAMNVVQITAEHPKLGEQQYSGVRFSELLTVVKAQAAAVTLVLGCSDGFMAEVTLADVRASADSMIAIGDDGTLNAVMPGMGGKAWAKDIVSMEFK